MDPRCQACCMLGRTCYTHRQRSSADCQACCLNGDMCSLHRLQRDTYRQQQALNQQQRQQLELQPLCIECRQKPRAPYKGGRCYLCWARCEQTMQLLFPSRGDIKCELGGAND